MVGTNVEHHGADSGGFQGAHSFEIYNNTFSCTGSCGSQRKHYFRSGTGVIFNNTYIGNYGAAELTNYRSDGSYLRGANATGPRHGMRTSRAKMATPAWTRLAMSLARRREAPTPWSRSTSGTTRMTAPMWTWSLGRLTPTRTSTSSKGGISTTTRFGRAAPLTPILIHWWEEIRRVLRRLQEIY